MIKYESSEKSKNKKTKTQTQEKLMGEKIKYIMLILPVLFLAVLPGYSQDSVEQNLMKSRESGIEYYIKLMYEGSHENKLLAAKKLTGLKPETSEALDALIYGLQQGTIFVIKEKGKVVNDFWDVRAQSAIALGEIGNPEALPQLYMALRYDPDNYVRSQVAIAIGKIGKPESIHELARTIKTSSPAGPDDMVIRACIEAIGKIGDKEGFVPLVEVIRGKYSRSVKLAAREALKKIKW